MIVVDGNEAAASVAHRTNEVIAIYPITPSSPMGEAADQWSADGCRNVWGDVPRVSQMQSEGGVAGAVHGALQAGSLVTTFTASQGLLLMIPDMYKIAGELTSFCMHVAARTVATHALSIFGDHSDVMACRQTGFAMLASASVQEAGDMAAIAQAATLRARVPFLHFFDGFRTSHELAKITPLTDDDLRALIDDELVAAHRGRALTPDAPVLRGTAQNPDTFFQAREAINPYYEACPSIVQAEMDRFAARTGRAYKLFEYSGHPEAERVVVLMGSGAETVRETVDWLVGRDERVGVLEVRLYRPFDARAFVGALPPTVEKIAVLDRTKEPGAVGDPLYLDVVAALQERDAEVEQAAAPRVVGGRYGLSSKEFTPAMVAAVFDHLREARPRNHFTVGIADDVSGTSIDYDRELDIEPDDVVRSVFYGLGSDGTVGANKNSAKIIGLETDDWVQAYFVYDSKKSGAMTISHVRFSPRPIRSTYLIRKASFVACHQFSFLQRYDVLESAGDGATFLLNAPFSAADLWSHLPAQTRRRIREKNIRVYVVDAYEVAREAGMGRRINTVMQACFFALCGVLPREQAVDRIKKTIEKTYAKKGATIVRQNCRAVDQAVDHLEAVAIPQGEDPAGEPSPIVPATAPDFVQHVTAAMLAQQGDWLPVSAFPPDGTWPLSTAQWEKRNIALEIPVWDPEICIQCNKCAMICPHAAIRAKTFDPKHAADAPPTFQSTSFHSHDPQESLYTIQVAPEDCTGCKLCHVVCPVKDKSNPRHKALDMKPQPPLLEDQVRNYSFFLDLPQVQRTDVRLDVKGAQFLEPLFEYSGACAGCGETPYVKLITQLFGDRMLMANATGCSSIYGGNLPTTPYRTNADGRGPAWSNSLFEDNAEFGFGFRLAVDQQTRQARDLLSQLAPAVGESLVAEILAGDAVDEAAIVAQRERVAALRAALASVQDPRARRLEHLADTLVAKSVWIVGGDGWAYDIGYGGLDHVLASDADVNVLVLDTQVYSNTGGQQSKATPLGAAAKFAVAGKTQPQKDLGLLAMAYGHVYVAQISMAARDQHALTALLEAQSYPGPSLVIAYSPCIAHGYDLAFSPQQQKAAVASGFWPLYRYDPRRREAGENPLQLDSSAPTKKFSEFARNELRFRAVGQRDPRRYKELLDLEQQEVQRRFEFYRGLATVGSNPTSR